MPGRSALYLLIGTAAWVIWPGVAAALPPFKSHLIQILPFHIGDEENTVTISGQSLVERGNQEALSHLRNILVNLLNALPKEIKPTPQSQGMHRKTTPMVKAPIPTTKNISTTAVFTTTPKKRETTSLRIDLFNFDIEHSNNIVASSKQSSKKEQQINILEGISGGKTKKPTSQSFKENSTKSQTTRGQTTKENTDANSERKSIGEFNQLMTFLQNNVPEIKSFLNKNTDASATEKAYATLLVLKSFLYSRNPKIKIGTKKALKKILEDELKVLGLLLEPAD